MNPRAARRAISYVLAAATAVRFPAAGPATAAATSTECAPFSSEVLRLHVINDASATPETLHAAILETDAIWDTAGLRLVWTFPPDALDLTDNRTVVLIIQSGPTRPPAIRAVSARSHNMPLLGQVPFGDDGPGNLIEVSFEAVTDVVMRSSYLNRPVAKLPDFLQQVLLGRGVGRVVAHEIGHWLAGRGHARDGLMKPTLGNEDLVALKRPRLPRPWMAAGAGMLTATASRCRTTVRGD